VFIEPVKLIDAWKRVTMVTLDGFPHILSQHVFGAHDFFPSDN
jgi:hypothetical protein